MITIPCEFCSQFNINSPDPCVAFPLNTTLPFPLGSNSMSPSDTDTISFPFTSRFPPSCGEVSSTTLVIPLPLPATVEIPVILPLPSTVITGVADEPP